MKKLLFTTTLLLATLISSCSNNDDPQPVHKNYVTLSVPNNENQLKEDSPEGLNIQVTLSNVPTSDLRIHFVLKNNENQIVKLKESSLTFTKGQKEGNLTLMSQHKSILNGPQVITVTMDESSDANVELFENQGLAITVNPDTQIALLSSEQEKMIEGYKAKYNLDLHKFLGRLKCHVKITYPQDEVGTYDDGIFSDQAVKEFDAVSIVTLSENATAEKPILKMTDNPLGLTATLQDMMRKETDLRGTWGGFIGRKVFDAMKIDSTKAVLEVKLDNLVLTPASSSCEFISSFTYPDADPVNIIHFDFNYNLWNEMLKKAETMKTINVNENGSMTEYNIKENIITENSLDPNYWLFNSDLSSDTWENEPSDWIKPASTYDLQGNLWKFSFPLDHKNSSGYTKVEVTYTLN